MKKERWHCSDKDIRKELRELERGGWIISQRSNKALKVYTPDEVYRFSVPISPGSQRLIHNIRAEIRRAKEAMDGECTTQAHLGAASYGDDRRAIRSHAAPGDKTDEQIHQQPHDPSGILGRAEICFSDVASGTANLCTARDEDVLRERSDLHIENEVAPMNKYAYAVVWQEKIIRTGIVSAFSASILRARIWTMLSTVYGITQSAGFVLEDRCGDFIVYSQGVHDLYAVLTIRTRPADSPFVCEDNSIRTGGVLAQAIAGVFGADAAKPLGYAPQVEPQPQPQPEPEPEPEPEPTFKPWHDAQGFTPGSEMLEYRLVVTRDIQANYLDIRFLGKEHWAEQLGLLSLTVNAK